MMSVERSPSVLGAGVCNGSSLRRLVRTFCYQSVLLVIAMYYKYLLLGVLARHLRCEHGVTQLGGERCSVCARASHARTRPPPRLTTGWWPRPATPSRTPSPG